MRGVVSLWPTRGGRRRTGAWVEPEFLEAGIDFDRANAARMYDYYLGGAHNFAVDRERATEAIAANPHAPYMARANRAFLGRVVRWCLDQGLTQFLDLGSGVPTVGNVHEIAHASHPDARVAYVDFEPVAVAHATDILAQVETATVTRADARHPETVLGAPGVAGLLDFDQPVAVLANAVLHFIDGDAGELLARYRAPLAPGSVVAVSHLSDDVDDPTAAQAVRDMCAAYISSATPAVLRDRRQLRDAIAGLELVEPGIVDITDWPEPTDTEPSWVYGAVARLSRRSAT